MLTEILRHVARLPVLVVGAVRHVILIGRHIVGKILERVGGGAHLEERSGSRRACRSRTVRCRARDGATRARALVDIQLKPYIIW